MTHYTQFETPLGRMLATASDDAITGIYFEGGRHAPPIASDWCDRSTEALDACAAQVREYLEGRRRTFTLPLAARGTAFQSQVWQAIAAIPYGETVTYATLAQRVGREAAARAVGAATGRNPLSIVVPCHRVLGSDGGITGYAGGFERKLRMLALERAAT